MTKEESLNHVVRGLLKGWDATAQLIAHVGASDIENELHRYGFILTSDKISMHYRAHPYNDKPS